MKRTFDEIYDVIYTRSVVYGYSSVIICGGGAAVVVLPEVMCPEIT